MLIIKLFVKVLIFMETKYTEMYKKNFFLLPIDLNVHFLLIKYEYNVPAIKDYDLA